MTIDIDFPLTDEETDKIMNIAEGMEPEDCSFSTGKGKIGPSSWHSTVWQCLGKQESQFSLHPSKTISRYMP